MDTNALQRVQYRGIADGDLGRLKTLNAIIFPINFGDEVYQHGLACGDVTQLALLDGDLIGAIVSRLEAQRGDTARLYIVSLGVLAPWRGMRIGSQLLARALAACGDDPAITHACLHVHVPNSEAVAFYERHGFAVEGTVPGYYRRLEPPDALLLMRQLQPAAGGGQPGAAGAGAGAEGAAAAGGTAAGSGSSRAPD